MAIKASFEINVGFGPEVRELYIRLNSVQQVNNHGYPANATFRGYASQEAFDQGERYVWEKEIEFEADVSQPLWSQAYDALKLSDGFPEDAVDC